MTPTLPPADPANRISVPALQVTRLGKSYGAFRALCDVTLSLEVGERLVILGPAGSGRSALLRCLAGIEAFQEGEVLLAGEPPGAGRIGMVAPETGLPPQMIALQAVTGADGEAGGRRALNRAGLAAAADTLAADLSGGERRRLAIARALVPEPAVMLFDEPTAGLEPAELGPVREVLGRVAAAGVTMICTTDDLALARRIAERVVFMDHGRIVETAPAARFLAGPASTRAQDYLAALG